MIEASGNEDQMSDYVIEIIFEGLDIDDPNQIDALAEAEVVTAERIDAQRSLLSAVIMHDGAVLAARSFVEAVLGAVPHAVPVAVDRDLVSVTDIADRVGVTREAVRHWSSGKRRAGRFPTPLGSPSGSKVWEWSAVHAWLRHNLGVWDELDMPTHAEYGEIDHLIGLRFPAHGVPAVQAPATVEWKSIEMPEREIRVEAKRVKQFLLPEPRWSERTRINPSLELVA